jgi:hypothetical protein
VARAFGLALSTVQYWLRKAADKPLRTVDWSSASTAPKNVANKTPANLERRICVLRTELQRSSVLGFVGAQTIHDALQIQRYQEKLPSVRTIGRILARNGLLDRHRRIRRAAPPPGWYLPGAANAQAELDSFDVIEDLRIEDFGFVQILTARALWGPLCAAWPTVVASAAFTLDCLLAHWRAYGLPVFAQFDNDTRFQGGHNHPDVVGRVMRLCLALGVTPVFAPPLEQGFQGAIENFNSLWQQKVWQRFHHSDLDALRAASTRFTDAYIARLSPRAEHAPSRRRFPQNWQLDLQAHPQGQIIFLRRTNEAGTLTLLGHRFEVDSLWSHRLMRCELDLNHDQIRFYRLRRREPSDQPLTKIIAFQLPHRRFDTSSRRKKS